MNKEEMKQGLKQGKTLIQEKWSSADEIKAVDELIIEGVATSTPWEYKDNFQCERRRIAGIRS